MRSGELAGNGGMRAQVVRALRFAMVCVLACVALAGCAAKFDDGEEATALPVVFSSLSVSSLTPRGEGGMEYCVAIGEFSIPVEQAGVVEIGIDGGSLSLWAESGVPSSEEQSFEIDGRTFSRCLAVDMGDWDGSVLVAAAYPASLESIQRLEASSVPLEQFAAQLARDLGMAELTVAIGGEGSSVTHVYEFEAAKSSSARAIDRGGIIGHFVEASESA